MQFYRKPALNSLQQVRICIKGSFEQREQKYDYIFIDCPPSLEMLTLNALCAADTVLIPVQCEYFALEGLTDLITTIRMTKKSLNPSLDIEGCASDNVRFKDELLAPGRRRSEKVL